jgi:hypothetical protein
MPSLPRRVTHPHSTATLQIPGGKGKGALIKDALTVVMSTDATLTGTITVKDPSNNVIGTATVPASGQTVVLQTAPVATAGTYTIVIGGANGTTGNYTVQAILNAAYKQATDSINTIGTAQDLSHGFAPLGTTPAADRAGVVGTFAGTPVPIVGPDPFGYEAIPVTPTFTDISSDPNATAILQGTDDSGFLVPFSALNGFHFNFYGQTYSASSDSLHDHMYVNTDGWMTFQYNESFYFSGGDLKSYPTSAAIAPMWSDMIFIGNGAVYYEVVNPSGTDPQLVIEWKNTQAFPYPGQGFTFEIVLDQNTSHIQFNYDSIAYGTPYDNGALSGVGIKDFGYATPNELTVSYHNGPNAFIGSNQSTLIGVNIVPETPDYYSFPLSAGQSTTLDVKEIGGTADVALYDGSGNLLALDDASNPGIISNFVAPSSGTYYAKVTGLPGLRYNMVVTRGADFDHLPNQSIAQAQPLQGGPVALGFAGTTNLLVTGGAKVLFFVDFDLGNNTFAQAFSNLGITPTVANSYSDFESKLENQSWDLVVLFDQNFFDTSWDQPMINYVDAGGHAIVASWTRPQDVAAAFGASYTGNNNQTTITQTVSSPIWNGVSNPYQLSNPGWGIFSTGLQATTGQSIGTFPNGDGGIVVGNGGHTILNGFLQDTPANQAQGVLLAENEIAALLIVTDKDFYSVQVNAGDNLTIDTTTPGGTPANGLQFPNSIDPALDLYDPNGNLVASASGNAGDGRNSHLTYTALATGTYYVRVSRANGTSGEYTVSVQGATGSQPPFVVTATNPAAGSAINFQPATMTVTLSDSVLFSSAVPADLTIDGKNATGVTPVNSHTVSFSLPALSDGVHSVTISGLVDIHGTTLTPDSFTFTTDTDAPFVVSSSINNGDALPPGDITEVVTFDEAMNPAATTASSFDLFGIYRNVHYAAASFSWNASDTVLTINYKNVPTDAYTLTLFAGGFSDPAGNTLASDFVVNFTMPLGTASLTGLQPVLPLGSLVYQTTSDQVQGQRALCDV